MIFGIKPVTKPVQQSRKQALRAYCAKKLLFLLFRNNFLHHEVLVMDTETNKEEAVVAWHN